MTFLVSDKNTDYDAFVAETTEFLKEHNVRGIALVALTDDGEALTAYWNMSLRDKLQAENEIRFDALDTFLLNNAGRYCNCSDGECEED
jgi:hypothetical protein